MAERIEWEEIERALIGFPGGIHARLLAALEAGEALHEALTQVRPVTEFFAGARRPDAIADLKRIDDALPDWRRCVAPRGEGA